LLIGAPYSGTQSPQHHLGGRIIDIYPRGRKVRPAVEAVVS